MRQLAGHIVIIVRSKERSLCPSFLLYIQFRAPAQETVTRMFRGEGHLTLINLNLKFHADICFCSNLKSHQLTVGVTTTLPTNNEALL